MSDIPIKIQQAKADLDKARKALVDAISEEYPKGSTITCEIGKSKITATVEYHHGLSDSGTTTIINVSTGKRRKIYPACGWQKITKVATKQEAAQ